MATVSNSNLKAERLPPLRDTSYLLLAAIAILAVVFHLGPAVIAGVFSYTIIDVTHRKLATRMRPLSAKWLSLIIFTVAASLLAWIFGRFLHQSLTIIPNTFKQAIPRLHEVSLHYGLELPFGDTDELRQTIIEVFKKNTHNITRVGGVLTKLFFHVIVGIFIAAMCFMSGSREDYGPNLYDALRKELNEQIWKFMQSFERVLGAQVIISAINTFLTTIFLLVCDFPHMAFLVPATFFLGVLPVVGNLLSNTIIVCTALTISPRHAAFALCFLVIIHKGEYFLNSRIIGSSIHAPMWQTLLGILIGEVIMGVPGIILAPAIMYYIRQEMREIPYAGVCAAHQPI
ncbi:MAG: AI-2E family transporter [Elusimicrobiota bacterium]